MGQDRKAQKQRHGSERRTPRQKLGEQQTKCSLFHNFRILVVIRELGINADKFAAVLGRLFTETSSHANIY